MSEKGTERYRDEEERGERLIWRVNISPNGLFL